MTLSHSGKVKSLLSALEAICESCLAVQHKSIYFLIILAVFMMSFLNWSQMQFP